MKFKYKQKKPRLLEEYLRGKQEDPKFCKCPSCDYIYNKENHKKLCIKCGSIIADNILKNIQ